MFSYAFDNGADTLQTPSASLKLENHKTNSTRCYSSKTCIFIAYKFLPNKKKAGDDFDSIFNQLINQSNLITRKILQKLKER